MKLKTYFEMLKKFSCFSVAIQTSFAIGSCKTIMKYGWTITKVITPFDNDWEELNILIVYFRLNWNLLTLAVYHSIDRWAYMLASMFHTLTHTLYCICFWSNNKLRKHIIYFVRSYIMTIFCIVWFLNKSTLYHILNWIHWDIHCGQNIHSKGLEVEGSLEQHTWNFNFDLVCVIWTMLNIQW